MTPPGTPPPWAVAAVDAAIVEGIISPMMYPDALALIIAKYAPAEPGEDTRRLDTVEALDLTLVRCNNGTWKAVPSLGNAFRGNTVRQAIDNARNAAPVAGREQG